MPQLDGEVEVGDRFLAPLARLQSMNAARGSVLSRWQRILGVLESSPMAWEAKIDIPNA